MTTPHPPDHGEFALRMSLNDDLKMIRQATAAAKQNTTKPGQYWQRLVAKGEGPEGPIEVIKVYHVDLKAGTVVITETVQGEETARRTRALDDLG